MKNNKGFTLIEILSVIVILGVLVALIVPNFSNMFNFNSNTSGKATEDMLIENLKLYNTQHEVQLWGSNTSSGDCYRMSIEELINYNSGITLGSCLLNSVDSLIIQKTDDGYGYYASITCSKDFKNLDRFLLTEEDVDKEVYYRSNNQYVCNNLS